MEGQPSGGSGAWRPLLDKDGSPKWQPRRSGAGRLQEQIPEGALGTRPTTLKERLYHNLDVLFCISMRGSTVSTEIRAGTTAFLATANNFIVNAHIMSHAGLDTGTSVVSGAFASAFACITSGILSNLPLGLVPSVGPNVFLAYSLVAKHVCTTDEALAISTACGVVLLVSSLTPAVKLALGLVPLSVKFGLVVGTGLLTALIGLKGIGVVIQDVNGNDIVALGRLDTLEVKISFLFLILSASMLHLAVKGAVLIGMLGATAVYWVASGDYPGSIFAPRLLSPHSVDFGVLASGTAWMQVGALLLMMVFSISGAVLGSARMAGLMREDGGVDGRTSVFVCCGAGTIVSGLLGSAPVFVSMSSAAGIRDGGRTGLVSVVIGIYSLLTAFLLSPLAAAIPKCAISPVLVLVGVSMTGEAAEIHWNNIQDALPAFLCAVFQPFTYSVANGIFAGVGVSCVLFFTTGGFIPYMPGLQRLLLGREVAKQKVEDAPGQTSDIPSPVKTPDTMERHGLGMIRGRSDPAFADFRDKLHDVGMGTTEQATWIIHEVAAHLGFDADAAQRIFEERMTAERNVKTHLAGGIPGSWEDLTKVPVGSTLNKGAASMPELCSVDSGKVWARGTSH